MHEIGLSTFSLVVWSHQAWTRWLLAELGKTIGGPAPASGRATPPGTPPKPRKRKRR